jgi:hypothetical protein
MNTSSALVALAALSLTACEKPPAEPAPSPAAPPASESPAAPDAPAFEPDYTLEFVTPEGAAGPTGVRWTALVNTGGWTMTAESVLVEPPQYGDGMNVRVFVILEQPAPGETVPQAMQTLTGTHDAAQPVTHAELSIKRKVRGDTSGFDGYYAVVKTLKPE